MIPIEQPKMNPSLVLPLPYLVLPMMKVSSQTRR